MTYSAVNGKRLADMDGNEVVISVASAGCKGRVNPGRLGEQTLNRTNVRLALLRREEVPADRQLVPI